MFKAEVKSFEASAPYNRYDSLLEVPNGKNPNQNAWLTIKLRVKLNFADKNNPVPGLTIQKNGKWYAQDWSLNRTSGWLFPLLTWGDAYKDKFRKQFQQHAEKVWNWQFLLITPRNYSELDYTSFDGPGWLVRPNVLCLFRLEITDSNPHRTINVVNLDWTTTQVVNNDPTTHPNPKNITKPFDAGTFRSDASDYDDADLFKPYMYNKKDNVWHDTIGHEIGHALGQDHIMILQGDETCKTPTEGTGADACYGKTEWDKYNIMGKGDRIYLLNAISWRQRMALHTQGKTTADNWQPTGIMNTPPRKMALGASLIGVPTF